jgi:hypothetical protein
MFKCFKIRKENYRANAVARANPVAPTVCITELGHCLYEVCSESNAPDKISSIRFKIER